MLVSFTRALQDGKLDFQSLTAELADQLWSIVAALVAVLDPKLKFKELKDRVERDLEGSSLSKLRRDAREVVSQLPETPAFDALKDALDRYVRGKGLDYKRAGALGNMALIEPNGE